MICANYDTESFFIPRVLITDRKTSGLVKPHNWAIMGFYVFMRAIKTTSLHFRDQRYSPLPGIPDDRDRHSLHYTIDTYPDTSTMSKLDVDNAVDAAAKKWKYSGCKIKK